MVQDMAAVNNIKMYEIEKKYPRLINCIGNLNTYSKKCSECPWAFDCLQMQKELKQIDFAPGQMRERKGLNK